VEDWAARWPEGADHVRQAFDYMLLEDSWPRALPILKLMQDETRRRGAYLKVFVFPLSFQLLPGYTDRRPQRLIMDYLRKEGIDGVDLIEPLKRAQARGTAVFDREDDMHPNAAGHRVVAAEVLKAIGKMR
jgi:lysophospholipase L1-like esterase